MLSGSQLGVTLPAPVAAQLGQRGEVMLASFTDAELDSVRAATLTGDPSYADRSTPFARLDPPAQEAARISALAGLTARGLAEPSPPGSAPPEVALRGDLWLIRAAHDTPVFYAGTLRNGQWRPEAPVIRPGQLWGVRTGSDDPVAVLAQELDLATGCAQHAVRTISIAVDRLAAAAFIDEDVDGSFSPEAISTQMPDGGWLVGSFGQLQISRRRGGVQSRLLRLDRQRGAPEGTLRERRDFGIRRQSSDIVDESGYREHLAEALHWAAQ